MDRGFLGGRDQLRGRRDSPHPGRVRQEFRWRHHFLALHERRDVPRAEAGSRRVRHQQRRHLRARVPLAHRLRLEEHARRIRRDAGIHVRHAGRLHRRHRCESDGRPPCIWLAAAPPAAPGRQAHRHRSARDRPRALAARRSRRAHATHAWHQRSDDERAVARHRDGRSDKRGIRRRTLRAGAVRALEGVCRGRAQFARSDREHHRSACRAGAPRRASVRDREERRDLLRTGRYGAQPGDDDRHRYCQPRHGHWQPGPRRRGRQPAARPEQRAGRVRHGLLPA